MSQKFRTHRLFQLLSWIDALSRGYEAPGARRPAEEPLIDEPHRMPTASNLAYYLLNDGDYNQSALKERFSHWAVRGRPHKEVFTYVKKDVTRHLEQYPAHLFKSDTVKKTPETHPTFEAGIESRHVEAKAYYLSASGQKRLDTLAEAIQFKQDLVTSNKNVIGKNGNIRYVDKETVLTETAVERISGEVDPETIEIDSVTVPVGDRYSWDTTIYKLPHIIVTDATRIHTPTINRE